ncbi:hypothetical protein [Mixta calida]
MQSSCWLCHKFKNERKQPEFS